MYIRINCFSIYKAQKNSEKPKFQSFSHKNILGYTNFKYVIMLTTQRYLKNSEKIPRVRY